MPIPVADATSSATLIVTGITLAIVLATLLLVLGTRASTDQARDDLTAQLELLRRQLQAAHRPLLVEALASTIDVAIEAGKIRLGVPLRNAGNGVAVIDGGGLEIEGAGIGPLESRAVQRSHVPVNETTRIDLVTAHRMHELDQPQRASWQLSVPYADLGGAQQIVARVLIVCRGDDVHGPWHVERVDQQSSAEPASDEHVAVKPEPAGDSTPAAPSRTKQREPVTDIWGNPIEKRGRRRR